jgi:predicted Zn-dependent protease
MPRGATEFTPAEMRRIQARFDKVFDREDWVTAEQVLRPVLKRSPEDHWVLLRLGDAVYEQRRYREALALFQRARALAPRCPAVRFSLALAAAACGDTRTARRIYQSFTRLNPETVADRPCWEGLRWARGLIADAHFLLGKLDEEAGAKARARRRYQQYLRAMERPAVSIASRREARARLRALDAN